MGDMDGTITLLKYLIFGAFVIMFVLIAAYAYISYQTAYVKYHYPKEYLCALIKWIY